MHMSTDDSTGREVLAFRFGAIGVVLSGMLVTAFTLNVVALTLPFMVMKVYGDPAEAYSIPRTVQLMWSLEFYFIAILIIGFSLIFPFLKLVSLLALWYVPMTGRVRGAGLRVLGSLGRWSLLDVFVALVLIVLSHDQTLFVTAIKPGLPLFLAAICSARSADRKTATDVLQASARRKRRHRLESTRALVLGF